MPRLAIILTFTVILVITGVLLSIPLTVRESLPIVRPLDSALFEQKNGDPSATLELQVETGGRFALMLTTDPQEQPGVTNLALRMLDHEMPPLQLAVQTVTNHEYRAVGWFPMPGRWQISLQRGEKLQSFQFIVQQ
jgi:hypothetical protein